MAIGLPHVYRFTVRNQTTQTIAANSIFVRIRRHKLVDGILTYEQSETQPLTNFATLTDGSFLNGDTIYNETGYGTGTGTGVDDEDWLGADVYFEVQSPASSNGNVTLYLDLSTDGGLTFNDNGLGRQLATLSFSSSTTKRTSFRM